MNLAKGLQYPQTLNMSQHITKGCREIYAKYLFQLNFFEKLRKSGISLKFATFAQYYSVCLSLAWRTSFYIHFFLYCIFTCGLVILIQFPDLLSLRNGRITTTNKQRKTTTKCLSSLITSCGPRLPKTYDNFKVVSVMQEVRWHVAWYYNKSEQYKSVHFGTVKIVTVGKWVL